MRWYNARMEFEWDPPKNEANIAKHGFDFADAALLFAGPMIVVVDTRRDYGEERWIGFGQLNGRVIHVAFTERGAGIVRVISMRKATSKEAILYERELQDRLGSD